MFRFQVHTRLSIGINVFSIIIKYLIMLTTIKNKVGHKL